MFRELKNECKIQFDLVIQGPLCIRSGESFELNPGQPDTAVVRSMWNGKMQPVIPGSSLKGVFRNRAEKYFPDCCN
ncbi:MAG: CRISPR-associated protein, partial [Clostridiaceae bacterium]|nr:CRISPR-associated protein [Clostridiaceae bacterium]